MTLPETLKAARIEAIRDAMFGLDKTYDDPMELVYAVIEANPLEQIAVDLVEALVETRKYITDRRFQMDTAPIMQTIDAALRKAGVR